MSRWPVHVEPVIRALLSGLLVIGALLLPLHGGLAWTVRGALLVCGLDVWQSALTGRGLVEGLLVRLGLRPGRDTARALVERQAAAEAWAEHLSALELLHDVVVVLTVDGGVMRVSERWSELFGPVSLEAPRSRLVEQVHPGDRGALEASLTGLVKAGRGRVETRFRTLRAQGGEHWVEGTFVVQRQQGRVRGLCGVLRDVTDCVLQEQLLSHMSLHDSLTGLPNRLQLERRVDEAVESARRLERKVALLFIDMDNFKQIDDLHGHKMGDELLLALSLQMRGCLGEEALLARWGGDEFVVLLPEVSQLDEVRQVAERLRQSLRSTRSGEQLGLHLTASIGGAVVPDDALSAEALFIQADNALFFAKSQGRDNLQLSSDMHARDPAWRDFDLTSRLVRAIRQGLLRAHYQPVVDARTGDVVGVEALARWHDETYGQVAPDTFIPMAEEMGLIRELGERMLEQSLEWFAPHARRDRGLCLSINVSNRQQVSSDFASKLVQGVRHHGVRPEQVKLEITESIAMEGVLGASDFLKGLREAGFLLSLDDFGTGFSSLSQLHALPVDELKIDRSFVRRLCTREGRAIVKAIVDMAHHLELEVVAEGVEDEETAEQLRALGVERLQGFHFSRPLAPEVCERLLRPLPALCVM